MKNGMLTIIEVEAREDGGHGLQSQSGRTECWMEGWLAVPEELEEAVWACGGYCTLDIQEGVLAGITPTERPAPPEPEPTEEQRLQAELEAVVQQLEDTQLALCDVYEIIAGGEN